MWKIVMFFENMKSYHAVSTFTTLTFCGAKNILGIKKNLITKNIQKTQLILYTKNYKDYVKTEISKFTSGHFMGPFRILKNLSSEKW